MALGALTLSVTQGVQGRPFQAKINGLTTGRVEVLGDGSPGFSTVNGNIMSAGLPYAVNTVVLREYDPGVGQGYRDSRIDVTAATRDSLAAQALASLEPGRKLVRTRVAGARQSDGSIVYSLIVEDDLGATRPFAPEGGGGTPAPANFRYFAVSPTEDFVIGPHPDGAIALHRIYGNGTNPGDQAPADSFGPPFGGWRIKGYRLLDAITDNPLTQAVETIINEIGSQEYAITVYDASFPGAGIIYGGTYHGGLGSYIQTGPAPADGAMFGPARWDHTTRITWPNGQFADITGTLELTAEGKVRTAHRMVSAADTSTAALALLMINPTFTRASLDQGATWSDISAQQTYLADGADAVWFRSPTTGTIVKAVDDARAKSNFQTKNFDTGSSRVKLRSRFDTPNQGPFGDQTVTATYEFRRGTPDPAPTWQPYTDTFRTADAAVPTSPAGYSRITTDQPNSVIASDGWTVTSTGITSRWVRTTPLPPGTYTIQIDYSNGGAYSAGGFKVASTSNGSSTNTYVALSSFTSATPTTKEVTVTVPAGGSGYLTYESSATNGRSWKVTAMRVTGTPA